MIFINKKVMNNKKFQLNLLKTLIREEIKNQNEKYHFFLNEDVASTIASTDVSAAVKIGTPELVVDKSETGMTVYINNVNGYKSFSLKGFDDYFKIIPIVSKKVGNDMSIKLNYTIETNSPSSKLLINSMFFKIQSNPNDKSIILELYYDFKDKAKYKPDFDFNRDFRQAILHGVKYSTTEKLDILLPNSISYKGQIS